MFLHPNGQEAQEPIPQKFNALRDRVQRIRGTFLVKKRTINLQVIWIQVFGLYQWKSILALHEDHQGKMFKLQNLRLP